MNNLIKIGLFVVIVFALLTYFEIKDVESQTRPTITKTRTRTATTTQTLTVTSTSTATQTETVTNTVTPSPTITFIPTVTLTPSATPVKKTEIKVFDNVPIGAGRKLTSSVINVEEFNEASLFLYSKTWGSRNAATCYFLPSGGNPGDRYAKTTITVAVRDSEIVNSDQAVNFGRLIGPRMVCEVLNYGSESTIDLYLYLIP